MELLSRLLPHGAPLHLETWHLNEVAAQLTLRVTSRQALVHCPVCRFPTRRIHRYDQRALADLPWAHLRTHGRPHVAEHWLVSWDGSPSHTGHGRTFVAEGGARRMDREQLPPDAPDLHGGEGVWYQWKHVARRHRCSWNLAPPRSELRRAIKRLRRKPHVMTACIAQAGLSIET